MNELKMIDCGLTSSPGHLDVPNQTEEKRPGNEVATTFPAHGIAKFIISVCSSKLSAPKPRNTALENKMKVIIEEENSNFDAAHWQAKSAEYEHFHGY